MQDQKVKVSTRNSFSEKKATGLLMFQGNVNVDNNFVNQLKNDLEKDQDYTKFGFMLGIKKDSDPKSISRELQTKYNCKIKVNNQLQNLIGLNGEIVIHKNDVPSYIIDIQNFCKKESAIAIEFTMMI